MAPLMPHDDISRAGGAPAGNAGATSLMSREMAAAALAAVGEAFVVVLAVVMHAPLAAVLAAHAAVVGACGAVLFLRRPAGSDYALAWIVLLLVAIAGPAGTLPLVASLPFARRRTSEADVVAAWYDRLARAGKPSAITQTYERIASGRVHRLDSAPPVNFLEVIHSGGMEERQRALGLIARHFHPDYAPVLEAALRSPEPVVRVQAAAVVARVREDLKSRVAALTRSEPKGASEALAQAGELRALQECALLAPLQQSACRDRAAALLKKTLGNTQHVTRAIPSSRDTRAALEDFLIAERRFKDLRVMRRIAASTGTSLRKVRRRGGLVEHAA